MKISTIETRGVIAPRQEESALARLRGAMPPKPVGSTGSHAKRSLTNANTNTSSVRTVDLFTKGDEAGRLKKLYNNNMLIGNNTASQADYEAFAERVETMFAFLHGKSPSFRHMIDNIMNATARSKFPSYSWADGYKFSIIVYDYDSEGKRDGVAAFMRGWRSANGRRASVQTDATPGPGTVSVVYLSFKNGLDINDSHNLETVAHEVTHAYQYFNGIVAPLTKNYIDLGGFVKTTGSYLVEFETVGSLHSPSAYSEMTVTRELGNYVNPTYRGHTPQQFMDMFEEADPRSYAKYVNSTQPYGVKSLGSLADKPSVPYGVIGGSLGAMFFVGGTVIGYLCWRHHRHTETQNLE